MICFSFLFFMTVLSAADSKVLAYKFHETVEVLTEKSTLYGQFVYFGDWPQTIKADDVIIDENQSEEHGAFTYYKGSDGYWYCKALEKGNGTNYSNKTEVKRQEENSIKYFKVEPIKWVLLTKNYNNTNKALIRSDAILDANCFYDGDDVLFRNIDNEIVKANNYKESRVRAYLNGLSYYFMKISSPLIWDRQTYSDQVERIKNLPQEDRPVQYLNEDYLNKGFLQTAFSEKAQQLIFITEVDNSGVSNVTYPASSFYIDESDYSCANTYDKVFLLSEYEITGSDYMFGTLEKYRIRVSWQLFSTDFAKANGAWDYQGKSFWWLRTPVNRDLRLARFIEYRGMSADNVDIHSSSGGIVPALCISLE